MAEIEDAASGLNSSDYQRWRSDAGSVAIRRRRIPADTVHFQQPADAGFVPGCARIYIRTWGCSHNTSDGEYMAGILASAGYEIVNDRAIADLWILNSCTVKTPSEDTFNNSIREAQATGKKVVLAGCVPQAQPRGKMTQGLSIVGVHQLDRVLEIVEETLQGRVVRLLSKKRSGGAPLWLPKIRRNTLIEIVPINTGCLNQCTYCKTKHARGDLNSYPIMDLVARVKDVVADGVVEIWLTSEDTGTYGRDHGENIVDLLRQIVAVLPDHTMLRVGMTNPPYILEHLEAIAEILKHPRVYSFLHIPLQSGSDAILTAMKREYNMEEFCRIVDYLHNSVPEVTIATDIICGFPGETEEDFQQSLDVCEKYKFPSLFINQFFPRPGTPAARMERVDPREVKRRTKRLTELFHSYRPYDYKIGRRYRVLVTDVSSDGNYFVAHNKSFDQVLVPKRDELMGKMIDVDITSTGKYFMMGSVVEDTVMTIEKIPVENVLQENKPMSKETKSLFVSETVPCGVSVPEYTSPKSSNSEWMVALRRIVFFCLVLVSLDLIRSTFLSL